MSPPTDAEALAALRTLFIWVGIGTIAASPTYDADRLPPGVSRDAYLRRHARCVRDGVPGWSRVGRGRVVTSDAWDADVQVETARTRRGSRAPMRAANDPDDALD